MCLISFITQRTAIIVTSDKYARTDREIKERGGSCAKPIFNTGLEHLDTVKIHTCNNLHVTTK